MKKILTFLLVLLTFSLLQTQVLAQTEPVLTVAPTATPQAKVEYFLPYPGILPDHLLYPLKMLRDKIMDLVIKDPVKKVEFLLLTADKRLGAGKVLYDGNKNKLGEDTVSKGEKYLERATEETVAAVKIKPELRSTFGKLRLSNLKHIEVLKELLQKAPVSAQPGLQNALKMSQKNLKTVEENK